jgi:hypothetical protein
MLWSTLGCTGQEVAVQRYRRKFWLLCPAACPDTLAWSSRNAREGIWPRAWASAGTPTRPHSVARHRSSNDKGLHDLTHAPHNFEQHFVEDTKDMLM